MMAARAAACAAAAHPAGDEQAQHTIRVRHTSRTDDECGLLLVEAKAVAPSKGRKRKA